MDALIAEGLDIWLDNPAKAGFKEREVLQFRRIRAGGRWQDEINEAKRDAGCILVCWSKRATAEGVLTGKDRRIWMGEADYGLTEEKLVSCTIDDVNPADLGEHAAQQMPCLDPRQPEAVWRAVMATLVADIKRKIQDQLDRKRRSRSSRDVFAPYLVDRSQQEDVAHEAMRFVGDHGGVRPLLLAGPADELPDDFLIRLQRGSANLQGDGSAWSELRPEWPIGEAPQSFARAYRRNLSRLLSLPAQPDDREIAAALENKGRLVAVLDRILSEEWGPDEPKRILAWLNYWYALAALSPRAQFVPILRVKMPAAKRAWRSFPPGNSNGPVGNRAIWSAAIATSKKAARSDTPMEVLPLLSPIRAGHADRWLEDVCPESGPERRRIESRIHELYGRGRAKSHGIRHAEFADEMTRLFGNDTAGAGGGR